MKTKLQFMLYIFILCIMFGYSGKTYSQINYTADFNTGLNNWGVYNFEATTAVPCNGAGSLRANVYYGFFDETDVAELTSPNIGTSVGTPITVTYNYKVLQYATTPSVPTPLAEEWGMLQLYYATSPTGPWTLVQSANGSSLVASATCTSRSITFNAPAGPIYVGIAAVLANIDSDVYVYIDDISITQPALSACAGTPAASTTVAQSSVLCNTQDASLSLSPAYTNSGITYQWQKSTDNVTYENIAGATAATYTGPQTANTWYKAIITCTASGLSATSAPVQVTRSGLACYCVPTFTIGTEPITLVNFAGINNTSPAALTSPRVENFTSLPPAQVVKGTSYPITLKGNTDGATFTNYFRVYIDFNHNGNLNDPGESFTAGSVQGSTGLDAQQAVTQIMIPTSALSGITYMRVIKLFNVEPVDPCGATYGYGQAEDYLINIQADLLSIDFANLQNPATLTLSQTETGNVYARVLKEGVTNAAGADASISAWIGISDTNTNPSTWTTWIPATYNAQVGDRDEYVAAIGADLPPGTYYYASRFKISTGNYFYGGYSEAGGNFWNGTTNVNGVLTVLCNAPAPTAEAIQSFCNSGTVAGLLPASTATNTIKWYTAAVGGTELTPATVLVDGNAYYASQTINGCTSAVRTMVVAHMNIVNAPTASAVAPSFCNSATIAGLAGGVSGNAIKWYAAATGGEELTVDTPLVNGTRYYASQTVNGCESTARTAVTAQINVVEAPTGEEIQIFDLNQGQVTISDIQIEGNGGVINWYATQEDALLDRDNLAADTVIEEGTHTYYATQTMDGCVSTTFAVTVTTVLGLNNFDVTAFKYYPNPVNDVLNISYSNTIGAVEVYNLVGQQVLSKTINSNDAKLDMSQLAAGTYIVKVTVDANSKVIKVIKR